MRGAQVCGSAHLLCEALCHSLHRGQPMRRGGWPVRRNRIKWIRTHPPASTLGGVFSATITIPMHEEECGKPRSCRRAAMAMTNNEILAAAHEVRIPDEAGVGRFSTPFQLLARADATVGGSSRSHEWKKLGRIDKRSLKHDGQGRGEQKQNKKTKKEHGRGMVDKMRFVFFAAVEDSFGSISKVGRAGIQGDTR